MYPLQERTNHLLWLIMCNINPSAERSIRLTDTIIDLLTTFLVKDSTGSLGAAESLLRETTARQGTCIWGLIPTSGGKLYGVSPASRPGQLVPSCLSFKRIVTPSYSGRSQRYSKVLTTCHWSPLFLSTALCRPQHQFPGPF